MQSSLPGPPGLRTPQLCTPADPRPAVPHPQPRSPSQAESRACPGSPEGSPLQPGGAALPPCSSAPSEAPQSPGARMQILTELERSRREGVENSGKMARAAAAGRARHSWNPNPPARHPAQSKSTEASRQPPGPRAGGQGKQGGGWLHLPLRCPARLDAHTDAGLAWSCATRRRSGSGERAGGGQASAPGAAAELEGQRKEGAQI